eukprot:CAMPEP_0183546436 /NCGR_PEP_ID=MMETSP0371-20130417/53825_1 /TAXON_ID=268820 /ORGANISM="Peridinium aciculiferum, Strain PAER-2" /LENGTH=44 /DNA_ID= /DNA_START= /DNA_END= /DNA_ORIENTATION=
MMPGIFLTASKKATSGSKDLASQSLKAFSGNLVTTLKSWQPPQT